MRTLLFVLVLAAGARLVQAQTAASPFLFTTMAPAAHAPVATSVDLGYKERAFEPVAGERLEQQASVLAPITSAVAFSAELGVANTPDGSTRLAEQGELLVTPLRRGALSVSGGVGARHEYGGTMVATARFAGAHTTGRSALAAGVLLEHPYAAARDELDLITSVGFSHAVTSSLWLGAEAVGRDLEGLWDSREAEGGSTVLVGPTLAFAPSAGSSWSLVVGGGPVLRTTSSTAVRPRNTGYVIRTSVRVGW